MKETISEETISQRVDRTWRVILDTPGCYDAYSKMNLNPYKNDLDQGLKPDDMPGEIFNYLQSIRELIKSWNGHLKS